MTAEDLVQELRDRGVELRADGGRILFRPADRVPEEIRAELRRRKAEVIEALRCDRPKHYEALARSPLVARVRAAWPWLAEHRPDLYQAVQDADEAGDVDRLRDAMEAASRAYENRHLEASVRIYSRTLDAEVWVVADEAAAEELRREGVTLPILLASEAMILGRAAEATARDVFAALAKVQRVIPGSRLCSVEVLDA